MLALRNISTGAGTNDCTVHSSQLSRAAGRRETGQPIVGGPSFPAFPAPADVARHGQERQAWPTAGPGAASVRYSISEVSAGSGDASVGQTSAALRSMLSLLRNCCSQADESRAAMFFGPFRRYSHPV